MSQWEYLKWTEEERIQILKHFDRTPETLEDDIKSIRQWMKKQPHLAKYNIEDRQIELLLIFNKFRVETCKAKSDMYFSIRPFFPEFFYKMHNKYLEDSMKSCYMLTLPALTKDKARIFISRLNETHGHLFNVTDYIVRILKLADIRSRYDCCLYDYYIIDCKWTTMLQISQFNPVVCKKFITILEKLYSLRCHGIYLVNAPKAVEKIINIFKQFLKKKLAERMVVGNAEEILKNLLPKSEIPKEYGGDGKSIEELSEIWNKKYEEVEDWLTYLKDEPVDERLRPGKPLNEEFFGIDGHFRKLNVD